MNQNLEIFRRHKVEKINSIRSDLTIFNSNYLMEKASKEYKVAAGKILYKSPNIMIQENNKKKGTKLKLLTIGSDVERKNYNLDNESSDDESDEDSSEPEYIDISLITMPRMAMDLEQGLTSRYIEKQLRDKNLFIDNNGHNWGFLRWARLYNEIPNLTLAPVLRCGVLQIWIQAIASVDEYDKVFCDDEYARYKPKHACLFLEKCELAKSLAFCATPMIMSASIVTSTDKIHFEPPPNFDPKSVCQVLKSK